MLNFDEEVVQFKLKGKIHKLDRPSNGQIKSYRELLSKAKSDQEKEDALVEFLKMLGMEDGVYDELSPAHVKKLLEALYETEKN